MQRNERRRINLEVPLLILVSNDSHHSHEDGDDEGMDMTEEEQSQLA